MHRRRRVVATALTVLAILPVAAMAVTTLPRAPSAGPPLAASSTTTDAVLRAAESDLFAPFAWSGSTVRGAFVQFGFSSTSGTVSDFTATNATAYDDMINWIAVSPWFPEGSTYLSGPVFEAANAGLSIEAHNEPTAQLEYRTMGIPHTVTLQFDGPLENVTRVTQTSTWPATSLSFTVGDTRARILLGVGALNATGGTVTAYLASGDLLVFKAVPNFANDVADRQTVLDAFGTGRLVSELAMVSVSAGSWLQSASSYRLDLDARPSAVSIGRASVSIRGWTGLGGLVLLAFDPATMPSDASHRLVVTVNGTQVPEASSLLNQVSVETSTPATPSFVQLAFGATVLVVYVTNLTSADVAVESLPVTSAPVGPLTMGAALLAAIVVTYAAAYMFRRRDDR